jgi:hypothetical protein
VDGLGLVCLCGRFTGGGWQFGLTIAGRTGGQLSRATQAGLATPNLAFTIANLA